MGKTTINLVEKLLLMVTNLTTKFTQLQSDNTVLKAQISELQDILSTKSCHTEAAARTVLQTWSHIIQRHPGKQSTSKGKECKYIQKQQLGLSSKLGAMSYKDILASNQHQQARNVNTSKSSRNIISTIQKHTAVNAVAEVPATERMDSAHVTKSPGNTAEDGYITMTMKKCGDIRAVKFSENNKIRKNFMTPMYRM